MKKGCLKRRSQDIAADGSRIEGSHKAWNALQRACASGIEMFVALSRDFVLRRNLRIITTTGCHRGPATGFAATTQGSHHIRLQNQINMLFNALNDREHTWGGPGFPARPVLQQVNSAETFGLIISDHNLTFGGLLQIKDELDEDQKLEQLISSREEEMDVSTVLSDLNIDPVLLNQPDSGYTISNQPLLHPRPSPFVQALTTNARSPVTSTLISSIDSLTAESSSSIGFRGNDITDGRMALESTRGVEMKGAAGSGPGSIMIVSAMIILIDPIRFIWRIGLDQGARGANVHKKKAGGS